MSLKEFIFQLEALVVRTVFGVFALMPVDLASAVGGWIGRHIAYRFPVTRRARRNLQRVFPDWSEARREACLRAMWDNLGRVAAEYAHIEKFGFGPGSRVEIVGRDYLDSLRDDGQPGIFFSGHFGNWELAGLSAARTGLPISLIYRAASNPYVNWLFTHRGSIPGIDLIPKGSAGARLALERLKSGGHLGMLVDQKMNDGIAVPFFGSEVMTAPALAAFALKYRCPVVPAHVVRIKGAHFRIIFEPPMQFTETDDRPADILRAMTQVNQRIEAWIREAPEQWLWLHQRWPKGR